VRILEAAIPVVEALTENLDPLFDALEPLIEVFAMLAEEVAIIIAEFMPPLVDILAILTPIVLDVAKAFLPLVQKLLPPFIALIESLLPFVELLGDYLTTWVLPVLTALGDLLGDTLIYFMDLFTRAFQDLYTILGPVWEFLKPILEGLLSLAGITPASLNKEITVTTNYKTTGTPPVDVEIWDVMSGKGAILPDAVIPALTSANTGPTAAEIKAAMQDLMQDTKKALIENRKDYNKAIQEANRDYAKAQVEISKRYDEAITAATTRRDQAMADALKSYNESVANINERSAQALQNVIQQSMDRLRDAFRSAAEVNVADMFSSDSINKSVGGLIDGLRDKLAGSRRLIANAAELASQGFSQTFIEQVVGAGAEVGNEMAEGILNATPEQQRELRELFGTIEAEASTGMDALAATLYEKNGLATAELKKMYDQVLIDQTASLAEQKRLYDETIANIMVAFNEEVAEAKTTRDEALMDAELALNEALLKANEDFLNGLDKIEEAFKDKIKNMKDDITAFKDQIDALNRSVDRAQSRASLAITQYQGLIPFADGGMVTGPTPALIGEAGPELVIPLNKVESILGGMKDGKTVNYYAAPNQSIDSEQELFQAMRRAKVVANW